MSDDLKVSKCLGFPVVVLPGLGQMPAAGEDEKEAARMFYVAATRATQRVRIGARLTCPPLAGHSVAKAGPTAAIFQSVKRVVNGALWRQIKKYPTMQQHR